MIRTLDSVCGNVRLAKCFQSFTYVRKGDLTGKNICYQTKRSATDSPGPIHFGGLSVRMASSPQKLGLSRKGNIKFFFRWNVSLSDSGFLFGLSWSTMSLKMGLLKSANIFVRPTSARQLGAE